MKIGFDYDYYLDETLNILDIQGFGGVWALPKRSHGNTVICISVASGSLYEPMFSGIDGIAHFLEHRLFWRNDKDVSEMFADLGIEINACTGFTTTATLAELVAPVLADSVISLIFMFNSWLLLPG